MKENKILNEIRKKIRKIINEEFDMIQEDKIELTFLRPDENTGNFLYKGSDGNIYVSIDGEIHDVTSQGEPQGPVYNTFVKNGEPVYNPEDRFGRNPGSKLQTEISTRRIENGIDQRENLEYFLSFNNDRLYWNWVNDEISDSDAIEAMKDIEGLEYDPKIDYKKDYSGNDSINEMAKPVVPISEKTKMTLTRWIEEKGTQKTAADLVDRLSETGMISSFPDSNEYGQGINKIEAMLSKGDLDKAYHTAKSLAKKLEKKANKEFGF